LACGVVGVEEHPLKRAQKAFKEAPEDTEIQQTLEKLRDEWITLREKRSEQPTPPP
jgi:hypothetical protein